MWKPAPARSNPMQQCVLEPDWLKSSLAYRMTKKKTKNTHHRHWWKNWLRANKMPQGKEGKQPGDNNAQEIFIKKDKYLMERCTEGSDRLFSVKMEILEVSLKPEKDVLLYGWPDAGTGCPESCSKNSFTESWSEQRSWMRQYAEVPSSLNFPVTVISESCRQQQKSTQTYWHCFPSSPTSVWHSAVLSLSYNCEFTSSFL